MSKVIVTLRIMPTSPEVDLAELTRKANEKLKELTGEPAGKVVEVPVAFGLKAVDLTVIIAEDFGGTDSLEDGLKQIEGVQSVEVTHLDKTF